MILEAMKFKIEMLVDLEGQSSILKGVTSLESSHERKGSTNFIDGDRIPKT